MGEGNLVEMADHRPHMMIVGPSGDAHVIPKKTVYDMASGKLPLFHGGQKDIDDDMVRGIIAEWLGFIYG